MSERRTQPRSKISHPLSGADGFSARRPEKERSMRLKHWLVGLGLTAVLAAAGCHHATTTAYYRSAPTVATYAPAACCPAPGATPLVAAPAAPAAPAPYTTPAFVTPVPAIR